ncbi:MAG TPA: nitroreductase family deazaflavin-dependent oxidoreductase [Dehalococcoidia bacterium]|nr:nitroreductase family deazaflavin-dependent oxidoreductase [Dehalococcoidia bacterium]
MWTKLRPPEGFAVLTTIGRKSGKPRRQSVRAIRQDDRVVVVAMMGQRAQWLKNIRANPVHGVASLAEMLDKLVGAQKLAGLQRRATIKEGYGV